MDVEFNLRDIDQECLDQGSQFWGSFFLFDDNEGQIFFIFNQDYIYFQTIFPNQFWLGMGWNEECQECAIENKNNYKEICKSQCLDENSFIVIGRHDLSMSKGWGFIDIDVQNNDTMNNYTLYNRKNHPVSYYDQFIDYDNVIFFNPPQFNSYTTDNIWAEFNRIFDAKDADNWSNMYEIEINDPSTPTCITYISSKGTMEHPSISAKYTQRNEIVEYWNVHCVNVSGLIHLQIVSISDC